MNSAPSLTGRIRFVEPTGIEESLGCVSVEQLLEWTNLALEGAGFRVWLVLDRLDVALLNLQISSETRSALFSGSTST